MELLDNPRGLALVAESLERASTLYLDTEFDSGRQGTELCVIQISDGTRIHLIDALRLRSLDALGPVLSAPDKEWVLHAAFQDVELLSERLRLENVPRVFDTQIAWALTSAEFSVSLPYLRFQLLGTRSGKSHQADDWRRRPLPAAQLAYAASDIEDLPALHRALVERLGSLGREHLVHAASTEPFRTPRDAPESLSLDSFRNAWQLDVHSQAALRALVTWYNDLGSADRANAPEVKTLLAIANRLPRTVDDLARIKGASRRFVSSFGRTLVSEIVRAAGTADAADFVPIDPPPYATFDAIRLDGWLAMARAELSAELRLAPELAFPSRVLKKLRQRILDTGDRAEAASALEDWRAELLAEPWRRFASR
jgi:ribonuclease D